MPDDALGGLFAGLGSVAGSVVDGIFGYYGQKREFAQQEKMTDKQNEWNSAQAQMQRAKEAGINPLTAAGAIAGSAGATGVAAPAGSAPATNFQQAGRDLATLGSEIEVNRANAESAKANARKSNVEADEMPRVNDAEILVKAAAAAQHFTNSGLPEIYSIPFGLSFARKGLQGFADVFNAEQLCRKFDQEQDYLDILINNENQRFADLQAQTKLHGSLAELTAQQKEHEGILTDIDRKVRDLQEKYDFLAAKGDFQQEFLFFKQFGSDTPEYKSVMQFVQDKFYSQSKGSFDADIDTAFDRVYNSSLATHTLALEYGYSEARIEVIKDAIKDYSKFLMSQGNGVSGIESAIGKLLSAVLVPTHKGEFNMSDVMSAKPPVLKPKSSLHDLRGLVGQ